MRKTLLALALPLSLLTCGQLTWAQTPAPAEATAEKAEVSEEQDQGNAAQALLSKLNFQTGDVTLNSAKAVIHANEKFRFLAASDAQKVLEELWGNPPDSDILGMIVPSDVSLDDEHGWAVVLTYLDEGYVSDSDASKMNYDEILKDLQSSTRESNAERKKAGYGSIQLAGWAERPKYDAANAKLYWAKDLVFDDAKIHTLNYDVRALGRTGYLSMNAVANMTDLPRIQTQMQEVIKMAEFQAGARYADHVSSDRTAEYGLAALLGAGVAAKTGLLSKLLVMLLAAKKVVGIAVVAAIAGFKRLVSGRAKS
jgi:uncharacterized membrane-anchored protein